MLKPNAIRTKSFETVKNGYDPNEVNEFLAEISKDYSELFTENNDLNTKLIKLVEKINEYREDEDAIKNAMIKSQKEAAKTISDAKAHARDMIESAKSEQVRLAEQSAAECEKIIREHNEQCSKLIRENTEITEKKIMDIKDSYTLQKTKYDELKTEVTYFKANLIDLYNRQIHLIMEMPATEESFKNLDNSYDETPYQEEEYVEEAKYVEEPAAVEASEELGEQQHVEAILNTGSFEPVIPKKNLSDLKFGKNN